MSVEPEEFARRVLRQEWASLAPRERQVIEAVIHRHNISRNVNQEFADSRTSGERVADRIAAFGGSWTFILIFGVVLLGWVAMNSLLLAGRGDAFDPYPYILLNLVLSMLAAIQAPVIMMSQNRQGARDRMDAAHDYQVNLKAEIEIRRLHEKLDELRERRWNDLVAMQEEQIRMLEGVIARLGAERTPPP